MMLPICAEDKRQDYPDYVIFSFAVPYDKIYFMKKDLFPWSGYER